MKIGPALDQAGLGGKVEDDLGPVKDGIEGVRPQVERVELEPGLADETGEVAPLDGRVVILNEGVDADDLRRAPQQLLTKMGTDNPRRARHHALHRYPCL